MSEIEKLYRNSGIEKQFFENLHGDGYSYPEFTAEKQLELIKWLAVKQDIRIVEFLGDYRFQYEVIGYYDESIGCAKEGRADKFEEALASLINNLWQNLTEEEKQQVKGILE